MYHLLTGATGLLGSYLLREFLRSGRGLAVVVRPSRHDSARQRIENIVARWEKEAGYALPRPVVLDGDLGEPCLGLDEAAIDWVSRHCESVIHNAASLVFQADQRSGEPRRSNVEGTRNVLELCRRAGIRRFHHVSTAFVCGLREGRIREDELDVGQTPGNAYEQSKLEAEKMVREAGFLDPPTVYRPGIIVGDSQTGYTATFHAFYVPLQLACGILDKIDPATIQGQPLLEMLGLSGRERKSLVPVDWAAAVISHIHAHPQHHGQTYHLTPRQAVPLSLVREVMEEVMRERAGRGPRGNGGVPPDPTGFARTFCEQMEVYRAYWRDDPEFDSVNTQAAAPHLPCPELDRAVLRRLASYALRSNFGWPKPAAAVAECDVARHFESLLQPQGSLQPTAGGPCLGLQVNGPGGGQWKLAIEGRRAAAAEPGLSPDCSPTCYLNSKTFQQLVAQPTTVSEAIVAGRVLVEGNGMELDRLAAILQSVAGGGRDAAI